MSETHVLLGRIGGYTRAALYGGAEVTHDLPSDLSPAERERRANALHAAHYQRIRMVRSAKDRARKAAAA